jgi:hypothetical protein
MPQGDKTGPNGDGPMTGRQAGTCAEGNEPGYANSRPRRTGGRRGGGGGNRGRGGGLRQRRRMGRGRGRQFDSTARDPYDDESVTGTRQDAAGEEIDTLVADVRHLGAVLERIQGRLDELEAK